MNVSMFLSLRKAIKNDKIELLDNHKNFRYMINKEWIKAVDKELKVSERPDRPMIYTKYSGYISITDKGKEAYFSARNHWIKWVLGTAISISMTITVALLRMILKC